MNHTEVKQMVSPYIDKNEIKIVKYPTEKELGNYYTTWINEIHTYKISRDNLLISGILSVKQEMEPEVLEENEIKIE